MRLKSTSDRYGTVAVTIHWITALLIAGLVVSGLGAAGTTDLAAKASILRLHAPLGFAILLVTTLRIAWWLAADKRPEAASGMRRWQDRAAKAVHLLFYIIILTMTASGIGMLALSDAGPILFGAADQQLPDFWHFQPRLPHRIGGLVMIVLFAFHVGAALHHQFVKRDGVLRRMWYGRTT